MDVVIIGVREHLSGACGNVTASGAIPIPSSPVVKGSSDKRTAKRLVGRAGLGAAIGAMAKRWNGCSHRQMRVA